MKLTTLKTASLVTALCLTTALTISSCGKKDKAETTTETTKTETTTPTTSASTAPATSASTAPAAGGSDKPLSAPEKAQLTPVKAALVMASTAINRGEVAKAKTQFAKVSSLWPTVQPLVKSKAGASYPAIASGIEMVKTAMGAATPDQDKAKEGLTAAIAGMNKILK